MPAWWDEHVVPRCIDLMLGTRRVAALRRRALAVAHGRVVEIGYGSGLDLPFYPAAVSEVLAVEPSAVARGRAAGREAAATVPVRHVGLDGQQIPVDDDSADTVVSAFTLCTVPDPARALAEIRRVLRPDGVFLFLEHGLATDERARRWQRRLTPLQRRIAGGCHLDRPVGELIERAGLRVTALATEHRALPPPAAPVYLGQAVPPAP